MSDPRHGLSAAEHARLAAAPRKPSIQPGRAPPGASGARVTTRSYDVIGAKAPGLRRQLQKWNVWSKIEPYLPDHQYTEFKDGRESYIVRGGPAGLALNTMVTPSARSPDYRTGGRIIFEGFVPGKSAREAVAPVARRVREIEKSPRPYGLLWSNSNWAMAEAMEGEAGRRIGDRQTVGYDSDARPAMPPPLGRD